MTRSHRFLSHWKVITMEVEILSMTYDDIFLQIDGKSVNFNVLDPLKIDTLLVRIHMMTKTVVRAWTRMITIRDAKVFL